MLDIKFLQIFNQNASGHLLILPLINLVVTNFTTHAVALPSAHLTQRTLVTNDRNQEFNHEGGKNKRNGGRGKNYFRNYEQDNRQNWSQDYRLDNETRCKMCNAWNHTAPNYP
jgi:hypothetical protein